VEFAEQDRCSAPAQGDDGTVISPDTRGTILLCTDVTVRGGVDRYVLDLARALRLNGDDVVVALEETTRSDLRRLIEQLPGVRVRQFAMHHSHDPAQLRQVAARLLSSLKPDRVHVICGSPRSCLTLREAVAVKRIPMVITEQQVKQAPDLIPEQIARIQGSYRSAQGVIFVSAGNAGTMAGMVELTGVSHHTIPNGVDVAGIRARAGFAPRPHHSPQRPSRLLSACRYSAEKGLDALVRAVQQVPAELVGEVNLYGDGPDRDVLEQLVKDLDLTDRVTLHGWRDDIPELLSQHDLFVLPSLDEGMPYALLEAMAAGIPVLASDVPGNVEVLDGGAAGTIVPRGDVRALAAAISTCVRDPDRTARLAEAAANRVRTRYDRSEQMRRTLAVWAEHRPDLNRE
jgi:glycosyltransferase involved in cell wall biosynthesis